MPPASGTSGSSQIRNCGESTFAKAANAATDAAAATTRRCGVAGPRLKRTHAATSAANCRSVASVATTSGSVPSSSNAKPPTTSAV